MRLSKVMITIGAVAALVGSANAGAASAGIIIPHRTQAAVHFHGTSDAHIGQPIVAAGTAPTDKSRPR